MCALHNGKVVLANAGAAVEGREGAVPVFEKEFCGQLMKIRRCNVIRWNGLATNTVACTYEPVFAAVNERRS